MHVASQLASADRFVGSLDEALCFGYVLNHPFLRTGSWNANGHAGRQLVSEIALRDLVGRTLSSLSDVDEAESGRIDRIRGAPIAIQVLLGVFEDAASAGRPAGIGALYVLHTATERLSKIVGDSSEGSPAFPAGGADEYASWRTDRIRALLRSEVLAASADVLVGVHKMSLAIGRYWSALQSMQRAREPWRLVQQ